MEFIINSEALDKFLAMVAERCAEKMHLSSEEFRDKYTIELTRDFVTGTTLVRTKNVLRMTAKVSSDKLKAVIEALAKESKEE